MTNGGNTTSQMKSLLQKWEKSQDQRSVFLSCYYLMTRNMFSAIEQGEFEDSEWVEQLLNRFADYYFQAITKYAQDNPETPAVWRLTLDAARNPKTMVLQNLFLGVNAHINFDLIFALRELLEPDWVNLSERERQRRYLDHCQVNIVIGRTIDSVQDQVIEQREPNMDLIDKILGPFDEKITAWLIGRWRDEVWRYAVRLVEAEEKQERESLIAQIEKEALKKAHLILV